MNDFHKNMGTYLDIKRNGPKRSQRKRQSDREPLLRQVKTIIRQVFRTFRIFLRRIKAFFGADHELDLNSLHQDVFIIERDEKRSTVFWRQFKTLFKHIEREKTTPTIMKNHLLDKKERLKNHPSQTSPKYQPEDVDMSKIEDIIKNNSL